MARTQINFTVVKFNLSGAKKKKKLPMCPLIQMMSILSGTSISLPFLSGTAHWPATFTALNNCNKLLDSQEKSLLEPKNMCDNYFPAVPSEICVAANVRAPILLYEKLSAMEHQVH